MFVKASEISDFYRQLARLLHQGFEPFLVAAAITGVVTQRLVPGTEIEQIPVAAVLDPDDNWREFICEHPELGELRKQIKNYPLADLRQAADILAEAGKISREQAALIAAG